MYRYLSVALLVLTLFLRQDAAFGQSIGNDTATTDYAWWSDLSMTERHDVVLGMIESYRVGYADAMGEVGSELRSKKVQWRRKLFSHSVDFYVAAISDWYESRAGRMNFSPVSSVVACLADKPTADSYCTYR